MCVCWWNYRQIQCFHHKFIHWFFFLGFWFHFATKIVILFFLWWFILLLLKWTRTNERTNDRPLILKNFFFRLSLHCVCVCDGSQFVTWSWWWVFSTNFVFKKKYYKFCLILAYSGLWIHFFFFSCQWLWYSVFFFRHKNKKLQIEFWSRLSQIIHSFTL